MIIPIESKLNRRTNMVAYTYEIEHPLLDEPSYRIIVWDSLSRDGVGRRSIGYLFFLPGKVLPLFANNGGAFGLWTHADCPTKWALEVLSFLTLTPEDTDEEYFQRHAYTKSQMDWATSKACADLGDEVGSLEEDLYA